VELKLKTRITIPWSHFLAALLALGTLPAISMSPALPAYCGAQSTPVQENADKGSIRFENVLNGSMSHKGATSVSFQDYKSEDGLMLESRIETYKSSDAAKLEFQKYVNRAVKVIQTNTKLDYRGRPVGQRAALSFGKTAHAPASAAVLWTDGNDLHILESSSLRNVLAFERQFHHEDPPRRKK
jgi:hypothetical protein